MFLQFPFPLHFRPKPFSPESPERAGDCPMRLRSTTQVVPLRMNARTREERASCRCEWQLTMLPPQRQSGCEVNRPICFCLHVVVGTSPREALVHPRATHGKSGRRCFFWSKQRMGGSGGGECVFRARPQHLPLPLSPAPLRAKLAERLQSFGW